MKKTYLLFAAFSSMMLSAQQKNTLLESSFWKSNPDVAAVKTEIAKGNNPSESNQRNMDVVTSAILSGASADVVALLLDQPGNSVSKITHEGRTYLHWAAMKGNPEVVEMLLKKGSDINLEEEHGLSPAYLAAANGGCSVAMFEVLTKNGLDLKKKYKDGANLLLLAISNDKDFSVTEYLISKGLSVKDTDDKGNSSITYAARGGNVEAVKKLVKQGVKYNDETLIFAAQGTRRGANTIEIYKYLVDELKIKPTVTTKEGETVLQIITKKQNQAEVAQYFIAKGLDVNKTDKEGNNSFMNAASGKDIPLINVLLPKVKNINAINNKGKSALTMAVEKSSAEVIALLLKNKADAGVKDIDGNSLAYYLIDSYKAPREGFGGGQQKDDFEDKIKLLQDKGVSFNASQKDGNTIYHLAVAKNDLNLLKKIKDLNVNVNQKNKDGLTALHRAAMISKNDEVLKYLVSIGAQKEIASEFNETAYSLAKENDFLTKNNVDINFLK